MGNKFVITSLLVQYPIYKHHALRLMAVGLGACIWNAMSQTLDFSLKMHSHETSRTWDLSSNYTPKNFWHFARLPK